jgi:hypothetical protein
VLWKRAGLAGPVLRSKNVSRYVKRILQERVRV